MPDAATGTRTISHMWCIDFPGLPGDSGGPFYRVNGDQSATAAGVLKGGGTTSSGVQFTCFSSWEWVASDLNVSLVSA